MSTKKSKSADPFALESGVPSIEGELRPKPKASDRISNRVIGLLILVVTVLMIIFLISFSAVGNKKKQAPVKPEENEVKELVVQANKPPADLLGTNDKTSTPDGRSVSDTKAARPGSLLNQASAEEIVAQLQQSNRQGASAPTNGSLNNANSTSPSLVGTGSAPMVPSLANQGSDTKSTGMIPKDTGGTIDAPIEYGKGNQNTARSQEQQDVMREKQNRSQRLMQARSTGLSTKGYDDAANGGATAGAVAPGTETLKAVLAQAAKPISQPGVMPVSQNKSNDDQDEKMDFVKNSANDNHGYHPYVPVPAQSKNEIKIGSFIPMRLQQGINTDLPGDVTARVSEGVYDTITGCRLLVPPLTTVIGRYDSKVAIGQGRALVIWHTMVFQDGAELNLQNMQSYDTSGMAGMDSDVDNHYLRMLGVGFGLSMITATTQIVVPQSNTNTNNNQPTYGQSIATALAQQYGQLGAQILGKYASVQPTLRNYVGEKFEIMVPRTIVFKKVWENRCTNQRTG